jgi:hypothetical protein
LSEPVRQRVDTEALMRKPLWSPEDLASFLDLPVKTIYKQREQ